MKKKIILIAAALLLIVVLAANFASNYFIRMISDYPAVTFDTVFQSEQEKYDVFHIGENKSPRDYGFDYEDISFPTYDSSLMLSAWYMEQLFDSIRSDKAILLIHGRTSNRLKPMKFLEIFKSNGFDSLYHFFLPDMRRSGLSPEAQTAMGYYFAEDLAGAIRWLAKEKGIKEVVLYGFSMGAQASNLFLLRDDINTILIENDVQVKALIMDSPLADVEATLSKNAEAMGVPSFLFQLILNRYDTDLTNNNLANQKIHLGINAFEGPVLLLQSKQDSTTHYDIFEQEFAKMLKRDNLHSKVFETGGHVKMYVTEAERAAYIAEVEKFLEMYLR